jgi:hypothetical protein
LQGIFSLMARQPMMSRRSIASLHGSCAGDSCTPGLFWQYIKQCSAASCAR